MQERHVALLLTIFVFGLVLMYGDNVRSSENAATGYAVKVQDGYRVSQPVRQEATQSPEVLVGNAIKKHPKTTPIAGVPSSFAYALMQQEPPAKTPGGMMTGFAAYGNTKNQWYLAKPVPYQSKQNCYNPLASKAYNDACAEGKEIANKVTDNKYAKKF